MDTMKICPGCQKPLAPNAPDGLCPACLMKAGAGTGVDLGPDSQAGGGRTPFVAPPLEEVARLFPQLDILSFLGQGGMGAVYRARQKALDRVVALKILPPGIGHEAAFAERFTREAKALARLNHPGVITLYEFGQADGLFYFLMEFVDGVNLRHLLEAGRVSPREALAIVPQICDALQYAHDQGIVHRDIKPENILLDRQGRVKVADFGLAKLVGTGDEPSAAGGGDAAAAVLTEAGKVMGTPPYMAPEQREHPTEVDHRADIYALGVVLYELLTGELPADKLQPPSRKVQIDVRLDEIVLRALEAKPELRYQTAGEFRTQLETVVSTPTQTGSDPKGEIKPRAGGFIWNGGAMLGSTIGIGSWMPMTAILSNWSGAGVGLSYVTTLAVAITALVVWSRRERMPALWGYMILLGAGVVSSLGFLVVADLLGLTVRSSWPEGERVSPLTGAWSLLLYPVIAVWFFMLDRNRTRRGGLDGNGDTTQRVSQAGTSTQARFARPAIVGACWAPFFFVAFFAMFTLHTVEAGTYAGPSWWQVALRFTLLPLGFTAPFGTTILGWIAVSQIRRSAGKLYGLGLAVFDGLLFPLLALDGLMVGMSRILTTQLVDFYANEAMHLRALSDPESVHLSFMTRLANDLAHHGISLTLLAVATGIAILVVDFLILRAVWRAVNRSTPGSSAASPAASRFGCLRVLGIFALVPIFALVAIAVLGVMVAVWNPSSQSLPMVTPSFTPVRLEKNWVIVDFQAVVSRGPVEVRVSLDGPALPEVETTQALSPMDLEDADMIRPGNDREGWPVRTLNPGTTNWRAVFVLPSEALAREAWENLRPLGPLEAQPGRWTGGTLIEVTAPGGATYQAALLVRRVSPRLEGRSEFPVGAHIGGNDHSVLVEHDTVDLHYVFYYAGDFNSSSSGSQNSVTRSWTDEGALKLKNGRTFGYRRIALYPDELTVNGARYDLRKGRVFVLHDDGTLEQLSMPVPLSVAMDPVAMATFLAKQIGTAKGAGESFGPAAKAEPPRQIDFKVLGVENPPGTRNILLHFERDTNYGLGLEVSQDVTPSPDGKAPKPGYRNWQQKMWIGLNGGRTLGWELPEDFTDAEVRAAAAQVESNAKRLRQLPDGALLEFATIQHRDGWKYHLLARVKREPGSPHPPAPSGALFTAEQPVVLPANVAVRVRLLQAAKDGKKNRLGEDLIFKTASDRATGFVLRWQGYGDKHPQQANGCLLDLVDADTGVIFYRFEHGFAIPVRFSTPDYRPLPGKNESHLLAEPGTFAFFHLLRAEQLNAPGAALTAWWDLYAEVTFISPTEEGVVPAFQLPSLTGRPTPSAATKADNEHAPPVRVR